jgi:hypothetical protein
VLPDLCGGGVQQVGSGQVAHLLDGRSLAL